MDVLDHSCSKLGFGGKMFIDGTKKFAEETDDSFANPAGPVTVDASAITALFPDVSAVNVSLLNLQIPCLIISVRKSRRNHVRELHRELCSKQLIGGVKMVLYLEHTVDPNDLTVALWRFCNNLDPKRDNELFIADIPGQKLACIGLDGTRKTKEFDDFYRDWPNIIVADAATIAAVDEKWKDLGLGEFIPSPSLKFRDQMYGEEAVVNSTM